VGIYAGITTPTEAASLAAAYALVVCLFFYRSINIKVLGGIVYDSAKTTASIGLMIGGTFVLNYIIANEQVPLAIVDLLGRMNMGRYGFLFLINMVLIILGCFLDANTVMLIFVPLILPSCKMLGIDLVQFGVVVVINTMIGLITPPYGVLLFVVNNITGEKIGPIIKEVLPFLIMQLALLFVLTFFPGIILFLPRAFGYMG
jgi:tripartite ATP-independent transporter DctM subunit